MQKIALGIIGTGKIAQEYIKIFKKLKVEIKIVCARKKKKLNEFCKLNKIKKNTLKIHNLLKEDLDGIVCCSSPSSSLEVSKKLCKFNGKILFEKPLGINYNQTLKIKNLFKKKNLFVALNRRYISSVLLSKKILKTKKKNTYFSFYDQENTLQAKKNGHDKITIKNWMYANSIHMVDLINFYVNSKITKIENQNKIFKKHKIYFSTIHYQNGDIVEFKSFWNKPAPWKIDISLNEKFLQLKPIETLSIIDPKKKIKKMVERDKIDINFKPGFYRQCIDFKREIQNKKNNLVNINQYLTSVKLIKKIFFN